MILTRHQYEELNEELLKYYQYAIDNMEKDKEGRLKENYALGVYTGMGHVLSLMGVKLDREEQDKIQISPESVEIAGKSE